MSALPDRPCIDLFFRPHPFKEECVHAALPAGLSLADIFQEAGHGTVIDLPPEYVRVFVDDEYIPLVRFRELYPRPGQTVSARLVPGGGGGGGGGKNPLATILSLAVVVAAPMMGAALAGAISASIPIGTMGITASSMLFTIQPVLTAVITGGIMAAGSMFVNAIAAPQTPSLSTPGYAGGLSNVGAASKGSDSGSVSPALSITGTQNKANKYGVVPRIFGTYKVFPPLAAEPFTEVVGRDQYLRMLFCVGYGPLRVWDIKIGDTPLDNFTGVEKEVFQGYPGDSRPTLYTRDVHEEQFSIALTSAGGAVTRRTKPDTEEIIFDLFLPRGLYEMDKETGDRLSRSVSISAEYRLVGGSSWTAFVSESISAADASALRRGYRTVVPKGQYDVRWSRTTGDTDSQYVFDLTYITALRSVTKVDPVNYAKLPPMSFISLRIKATDQLNGTIDQLNCMAASILKAWNGSALVDLETGNPAWVYLDILRGTANTRPVPDERIDMDRLKSFADFCDAKGLCFNGVVDFASTKLQVIKDVLSVGRGSFSLVDTRYAVVWDDVRPAMKQHVSPKNSWGFRGSKKLPDRPHALRVRFVNRDADYQQDERFVYADGYDEVSATKFENMDIWGVTDPDQVWKDGRYFQAVAKLRPETYEVFMDAEHLVCTRGDRVQVAHDSMLVGLSWGRVKRLVVDLDLRVSGFVPDEICPMEEGKSYCVRVRKADGSDSILSVRTIPGEAREVEFLVSLPQELAPEQGDHFLFGEAGRESAPMLVSRVESGPDLSAKLTLIDYAPEIFETDTGPIPDFQSYITAPPSLNPPAPPKPVIHDAASDERVLLQLSAGLFVPRLVVAFQAPPSPYTVVDRIEAQYRPSGGMWVNLPDMRPDEASLSLSQVEEGFAYDVRLRSVSVRNAASDWSEISGHTVVGQSSPPPDVATLMVHGRTLRWTYANKPVDHAGFLVRYNLGQGRNWAGAIEAHQGLILGQSFEMPGLSGTVTVMVKARDYALNESVSPAYAVLNLGDLAVENVILERDELALGWPGALFWGDHDAALFWGANDLDAFWRSVLDQAGALVATDVTRFWQAEEDPFWGADDSAPVWNPVYAPLVYSTEFATDEPLGTIRLDVETEGEAPWIEYAIDSPRAFYAGEDAASFWSADDTVAFWTPLSETDWLPWPGQLAVTPGVWRYLFRVSISGGPVQGRIGRMVIIVDVPDESEAIDDLAIPAQGLRLPLSKVYRFVRSVILQLQDDGGSAERIKVLDKLSIGPMVQAFDGSGSPTTATIDALIQGAKG